MIVEFFSAAISVSVPRNLSWKAWGFLEMISAALGDERRPARVLPELPDQEIMRAYERAAVQNVLPSINEKIFYGYWSVCADGQGFGYGYTYPSLDGHEMVVCFHHGIWDASLKKLAGLSYDKSINMRISFNQPAFIPGGGFFAQLLNSDRMVLLDETLLAHGFTYVNRNRIKGPLGEVWMTVPLKRKGRGDQKIKDLEIYEKAKWAKKFLLTLKHFYGKSVYFEPTFEKVKEAVEPPDRSFMNLALALLNILTANFEIDKEMTLQSKMGITGKGTPLLVSLAKELGGEEVILPYFSAKAVDCAEFKRENIKVQMIGISFSMLSAIMSR
jgi:hypothetical protein